MPLHAIAAAVPWILGDNHAGFLAAFAQFAQTISPVTAETVSQTFAQIVIDAFWQGTAVALALYLSLRLAPRASAVHRFAAWTAGFAAVAALPFLPFVAHFASATSASTSVASTAATPHPWVQFDSRWALVIAALWLAASAFRFAELIFHTLRLRKLWKSATPLANDIQLGLGQVPHAVVCTTSQLDRPGVIGFFAPRILIPDWLYARLTPQELAQVVLHEAEHLRRHDDWTNLIQKFVLVLFPLNPALAWIERRLCREREMACDEGVVSKTQAPRAYAACLASLAERKIHRDLERRAATLSLAAWRRRPELVHRVQSILRRQRALHPVAARAFLGALACGLLTASVELARCPQVVAFVAAPEPQQIAQADAVISDRAYTPVSTPILARNTSGFHMVDAKAILPARPAALPIASTPRATHHSAVAAGTEIASRDANIGTLHATYLRAELPSSNSEQPVSSQPQYFVFTAIEQVQTIPQSSREIADYDTGATDSNSATAQHTTSADSNRTTAPAQRITITRLIFRIAPASFTAAPNPTNPTATKMAAPNSAAPNTSHATDTKPVQQPTLIPFGNGWLVLQL